MCEDKGIKKPVIYEKFVGVAETKLRKECGKYFELLPLDWNQVYLANERYVQDDMIQDTWICYSSIFGKCKLLKDDPYMVGREWLPEDDVNYVDEEARSLKLDASLLKIFQKLVMKRLSDRMKSNARKAQELAAGKPLKPVFKQFGITAPTLSQLSQAEKDELELKLISEKDILQPRKKETPVLIREPSEVSKKSLKMVTGKGKGKMIEEDDLDESDDSLSILPELPGSPNLPFLCTTFTTALVPFSSPISAPALITPIISPSHTFTTPIVSVVTSTPVSTCPIPLSPFSKNVTPQPMDVDETVGGSTLGNDQILGTSVGTATSVDIESIDSEIERMFGEDVGGEESFAVEDEGFAVSADNPAVSEESLSGTGGVLKASKKRKLSSTNFLGEDSLSQLLSKVESTSKNVSAIEHLLHNRFKLLHTGMVSMDAYFSLMFSLQRSSMMALYKLRESSGSEPSQSDWDDIITGAAAAEERIKDARRTQLAAIQEENKVKASSEELIKARKMIQLLQEENSKLNQQVEDLNARVAKVQAESKATIDNLRNQQEIQQNKFKAKLAQALQAAEIIKKLNEDTDDSPPLV